MKRVNPNPTAVYDKYMATNLAYSCGDSERE